MCLKYRWALVMRDWSRGQALGYYSIRPSQFNTRMPLHVNDDDLCPTTLKVNAHGCIGERPRSEFTMLSYTVHALEITIFAREFIDLRGPLRKVQQEETKEGAKMWKHLHQEYDNFLTRLPPYFRLGSSVGLTSTGPMAAIPVQRWMLQQQLWSLFLRLHRASLLSQDGRASCQLLAQNIISNQAQIQARCAVCGSLSTNETQLFNAAIVLLVDLLSLSKRKDTDRSSAQLNRLMTRDKIREAVDLLGTRCHREGPPSVRDCQLERLKPSVQRSVIALEALMKVEEDEFGNSEGNNGARLTGDRPGGQRVYVAKKSLKDKVIDILNTLRGNQINAAVAMEEATLDSFSGLDTPMPLPTAADGFQDLDVLPLLSNDPSCNFWPFFDFPAPQYPNDNGSFSATADLQAFANSMPFSPSSGMAPSTLSSLGTPDFSADIYSNNVGIGVTQTPPSSIESPHSNMNGGSESAMTPSSTDAYVAAKFY